MSETTDNNEPATKQIALTRGLFATVDAEDFDRLNVYRWRANPSRKRSRASLSANEQ